jgi:peroxiredoxin
MLIPGQSVPDLDLPLAGGGRFRLSAETPDAFTLLVFYRGKHCPICRGQLEELAQRLDEFTRRGIKVFAISMDNEDRAMATAEAWKTGELPLALGLSEDAARAWGLYLSSKREGSEEPEVFSEPGLFLVRPDGTLFFAVTQNAPFTRPPLDQLLKGMDFVLANDYPTRGTAT